MIEKSVDKKAVLALGEGEKKPTDLVTKTGKRKKEKGNVQVGIGRNRRQK